MTHPMHQIAKALSAYGRQGDTKLAHVTPREEKILKSFGGVGSKNPHTGLVEFFHSGAQEPGGGSESIDQTDRRGEDRDYGRDDSRGGDPTGSLPASKAFTKDPVGMAVGALMPGAVPAYKLAQIAGPIIQGGIESLTGLKGSAPAVDFSYPEDRSGRDDPQRRQGPAFAPGVPGIEPLMRPEAMGIPSFLSLSPAQTPLQQRSQIATFGTQGVGGYGGQEAQDYWKNLVMRSFLDNQGGLVQGGLLPIEQQYASQNLGLQPSGDMMEFLRSMA